MSSVGEACWVPSFMSARFPEPGAAGADAQPPPRASAPSPALAKKSRRFTDMLRPAKIVQVPVPDRIGERREADARGAELPFLGEGDQAGLHFVAFRLDALERPRAGVGRRGAAAQGLDR